MNFEKITDKHTNSQAIQSGIGRVIDLHIPFQPELIGIDIRIIYSFHAIKRKNIEMIIRNGASNFIHESVLVFIRSKSEKGSTR